MKLYESQCLKGNECKLLAKSLHWDFESFIINFVINFSI
ncbi:hypothetical protein MC28_E162 (plasmid) [Bacillus thuringiensis MC28]|nr:hypothetical protein MC28_E162 [Bacillus thuringiensis MC28]